MRYFILLAGISLILAGTLEAQKGYGGGNKGNTYKKANEKANKQGEAAAKKAQNNAEQAEKEAEREKAKEEREEQKTGENDSAVEDAAEDAAEDADQPGTTVSREIKDETLDEVMDELGLEDKAKRSKFKSNVRKAWEDSETEDKRYAIVYKRYLADSEKLEAEKRVHTDKLKKIWDASDEKLTKDEALTEAQLKTWQEDSEDLRTKTSTDYYYEALNKPAEDKPARKEKKEAEGEPESEEGRD